MKEEQLENSKSRSAHDPLSNTTFTLQAGQLLVQTQGQHQNWTIPPMTLESRPAHRQYLHFATTVSSQLQVNPWGNLLISHSDRFQEADLSPAYNSGSVCWQFFVPHTMFSLTVGVKDKKNNQYFNFDFSFKESGILTFKLNLKDCTLKAWINGIQSPAKPTITLPQKGTWTPFVRIRQSGTSLALNPFAKDPERAYSNLNPFPCSDQVAQLPDGQDQRFQEVPLAFKKDESYDQVRLIGDYLVLVGPNKVKAIPRSKLTDKFQLDRAVQEQQNGAQPFYLIKLSPGETNLFRQASQLWKKNLMKDLIVNSGCVWLRKTKQQWLDWAKSVFKFMDQCLLSESNQLVHQVYQLCLSILSRVTTSNNAPQQANQVFQTDKYLIESTNRHFLKQSKNNQSLISKQISLICFPAIQTTEKILGISLAENYISVFVEGNKVSIYSISGTPFKLGDYIFSKPIKKQNELTECAKQADEIRGALGQPFIYKILKNCLKYADKVRPPEKLVKQLQNRREKLREKQKKQVKEQINKVVPNKDLEGTLVQMGFDSRIVRKALIQSNNASLQMAMDLILGGTIVVQEEKPPLPSKDWTCQVCTLVNAKTAIVCAACDAPIPAIPEQLEKAQIKKEIEHHVENIEEDIASQRLQQPLSSLTIFPTGIALAPIVAAGIFKTTVRFRLFALNPRFFSNCYAKGDLFSDLISYKHHEQAGSISATSIEKILAYLSPEQCKQRSLSWIALEDIDVNQKGVKNLEFVSFGLDNQTLRFKATLDLGQTKRTIFFSLDTSKTYLQKQRSLVISPELKQILEKAPKIEEILPAQDRLYRFDYQNELVSPTGFEILLGRREKTKIQTEKINLKPEESNPYSSLLQLYVAHSCQQTQHYPYINFTSPWIASYNSKLFWQNGVVLGNLKHKLMRFDSICLEIKKKDEKLTGYFYFANDYTLQPVKIYRFSFEGGVKKLFFVTEKIKASYLVIVLEPNSEDKLIQLSSVNAYGEFLEEEALCPTQLKVNLKKLPTLLLENSEKKIIQPKTIKISAINSEFDLTVNSNELLQNIEEYTDLKIIAQIDCSPAEKISLKKIELQGFSTLRINSLRSSKKSNKTSVEISEQFKTTLSQYLLKREKQSLQRLISTAFSQNRQNAQLPDFKAYLTEYVISLPFGSQQLNDVKGFFGYFLPSIKKQKQILDLTDLIEQGLRSNNLTANGLELLIWLNRQTEALTTEQLSSLLSDVAIKISHQDKKESNKQYDICSEESIFSPYLHTIGKRQDSYSCLDRLHSKILVKKIRYSRIYTVDLFSCYKLRQLQLHFSRTETKNKLLVGVSWFNKEGKTEGNLYFGYNYPAWNNLVSQKKSINRVLAICLKNFEIQTRYIQIEVSFTIQSSTACKSQIKNLADNEIIPALYGSYIGQEEPLPQLNFNFDKKQLYFIKKIGAYSGYRTSKADTMLYMEEKVESNQQNLQMLKNTLELKVSRDKWLSVMMRNPSQNNLNYHYTLFAVLAEEIIRMKSINQPSSQFIKSLVSIMNKQSGTLLDLSQKLLKLILQKYPTSFSDILNFPIESGYISIIFKKSNPFTIPQSRKLILKELNDMNLTLAKNCLNLFCEAYDSSNQEFKQIYAQLHNVFFTESLFEECVVLHQKNGWITGIQSPLIYDVFEQEKGDVMLQRLCKSARNTDDLAKFLSFQMVSKGPSQALLAIVDQLALRTASSPIDGNQMMCNALEWIEKADQSNNIPPNLIERLLKVSSSFTLNIETISLLIDRLFQSPDRNALWSRLKSLTMLQGKQAKSVLLRFCIKYISNWINTPLLKRGKQLDLFSFISQVLSFVGVDNAGEQLQDGTADTIHLLSKLLIDELNWGGREGCRFLDKESFVHLNIAYYLAKLSPQKEAFDFLEHLIKWYLLNHNKEDHTESKTTAQGQFSYIQNKVWTIIVTSLENNNYHSQKIYKTVMQFLNDSHLLNRTNRYLAVTLRAKVFWFIFTLLKEFKNKPQIHQNIRHLLDNHGFFKQILITLENQPAFENEDNQVVKEDQLANKLTVVGEQQPQDWLIHKNGAKNHIFELKYEGKQSHSLYFEREQAFWPSLISVGFQTNSSPAGTVLAPREVLVEFGDSKDKMNLVGHLSLIPLQTFDGFSVKVYAINLQRIKGKFNSKGTLKSHKVLKLTFMSPYDNKVTDGAEEGSAFLIGKQISYISFLSILGFSQTGANFIPEDVNGLVGTLDQLSDVRHLEDLTDLLQDEVTAKLFEKSIKGISFLLSSDKFGNVAHKFLLRACQVNSSLGEGMLNEYLRASNPVLSAKMVGQIVLTSQQHSISRVKRYYNSILQKIEEGAKDVDVIPYLDNFSQTMSTLQRNWLLKANETEPEACQVSQKNIEIIVKKASQDECFRRFAKTLLTVAPPLTFSYGAKSNLIKQKIWQQLFSSSNSSDIQLLATLINSDKACREWFVSKDYLNSTFKQIFDSLKTNDSTAANLVTKLRFLTLLCRNAFMKQSVTKAQLDLQLFELLVHGNSEGLLAKAQSKKLRECLVSFIAVASLGSANERIIGALLKDSLNTTILEGSSKFVGEVFLPLLNSYSKTVVCMVPYSVRQNKILADLSSLQHFQSPSKVQLKQSDKFRLSSMILPDSGKNSLFDKIKEVTNYKWGVFKLITNHGPLSSLKNLTHLREGLAKHKQVLMLIETKKENPVLGLFLSLSPESKRTNKILPTKNSFLFEWNNGPLKLASNLSTKDPLITFQKPEQGDTETLNIHVDGKVIVEISYDGFGDSTVHWNGSTNNISSVECWYFDSQSHESYEHVWANQKAFAKRLLSQLSDCSFFRPEFKVSENIKLLRQQPLFEFPSSLTVKDLLSAIQILGKGTKPNSTFELRMANGNHVNLNSTLQQLAKAVSGELIFDLLIDLQGVIDALDMGASDKKADFLPNRGILKYFQENDGVKSMIKAIKKSIGDWNNVARRQKWMQYISELQKFSGFPHFFGVYLREKETFSLLLDLLSGLPDKEVDAKWDEKEVQSSQRLLKIVSDILNMENSQQFRSHALKHDFLITILERLRILTGTYSRKYQDSIEEEEEVATSPEKKKSEDDGTKKIKKKKGVGYSAQTNSNTKWMKGENLATQKKEFESVQPILELVEGFLGGRSWKAPHQIQKQILNSCLLPFVEECLRAGTLLEMSKHPEKYRSVLKLIRALARQQNLVSTLIPISPHYQPSQIQSLESLLKILNQTSTIFLSCLSQNLSQQDKISQELANDIISTYNIVEEAISQLEAQGEEGGELQHALTLPLDKKYRVLMKELRFDYMDMKEGPNKIKHHYASNFQPNYKPNQNKMIRLAQQLADISSALPHQHTNAVYVRCDKDRVDFMQALIMGSNGTPYGHGAFLFDIYFDDNYPNGPPKVNLTTTGHGKIRFNPNLYACGKVCLSLLGTWRGSASENWDPKVSTLLQVLLSIQAIIMSEEVYFNEPGFENQQGTEEGEKKNQAYSNIVRYGNLRFAMIENIKNPPKGFESVIRRHFYLKKDEIMEQCNKWLKYAEKRPANYIGLVNDHNSSWAAQFKKSKTQYKQMLQKAVTELEEELNKLPPPSLDDLASKQTAKKEKKKKEAKNIKIMESQQHEEIDVSYEKKMTQDRQLDINDEKVRDRWSRYIGAMGIDAVGRQAKADILVLGLAPFALEVVKNLVLSGCRKMTIVEEGEVEWSDLSGGFFYQQEDVGKKKVDSVLYKIRQLNCYVKVDTAPKTSLTPEFLSKYTLVLATDILHQEQIKLSKICREKGVKFVSADCFGAACRITNDYGKFQVLDKNGEQPIEVMIKNIEISEQGIVTLLDGAKHPYEDGEAVLINQVQGMKHKEDPTKSINGLIRKVKVINFRSFEIGDTRMFQPYTGNGTAKNIKTPVIVQFPPLEKALNPLQPLDFDANLQFFDFAKQPKSALLRLCFITLDQFRTTEKRFPEPWNLQDGETFKNLLKKNCKQQLTASDLIFVNQFAYSCKGNLPPLCAFFGGFVSQEIIKGITQKYKPVTPSFYLNFMELLPTKEENKEWTAQQLAEIYKNTKDRDEGLSAVVGRNLMKIVSDSRIFMVGAGAIGCQLLKNFAMISLGTGETGKIILTDPDHIENSNLNRQFLFRQKHISKPKSLTAAASVTLMNPKLKNHISALLERVSEGTRQIFSNRFFGGLSAVANALDNVAARRYVDQRCVENQIALFQSGTLGPKGHVQVILPFKTESYGSQNDPVEQGEIPHCTLKLFPEETLHCIEWARDIFGRKFALQPKALAKFLEKGYIPDSGDIKALQQSLKMVTKGPKTFDDCIQYALKKFYKYYRDDVMQLLYTYPLDAKTKNGEPFWRLPKRPPTPIKAFNPEDLLHATFVMSLAVLTAKIYQIPFPSNFRSEKERLAAAKQASAIKIEDFVPSDEKAKAILKEAATDQKQKDKDKDKQDKEADEQDKKMSEQISSKNEVELYEEVIFTAGSDFTIKSEQFEKDDDANGHIDFIYAASNLRALNYKLDPMDWITTKLKAGRIVPALVTTTSCVAGLQTLELLKYFKKLEVEHMRNAYLNLAVPSLQMSEPGQLKKNVLKQGLSVTLWDRWELQCSEDVTFGEVYERLKKEYGLWPVGVLQGMSRVDFGKSAAEKKKFLSSKVLQKLQREEEYLDIVVLFTLTEQDEKILQGVPQIRLLFGKK